MSKKNTASSQKRAAKRNARTKTVQKSANRNQHTNSAKAEKLIRSLRNHSGHPDFDNVLKQAVRGVNKNLKSGETPEVTFNTKEELMAGIKKAVSEVFKLYSYVTVAEQLIEKQVIQHEIKMDLYAQSLNLVSLDKRISRMELISDEAAWQVEALEIGTLLEAYSDNIYNEVARLEPFGITIEETITRLAEEVEDGDTTEKRRVVLESIAYSYLHKAMVKYQEENPAPAEHAPEALAEEPAVAAE